MPPRGKIYSVNEGNMKYFDEPSKNYVNAVKEKYSSRYVGSMVADVHRTLWVDWLKMAIVLIVEREYRFLTRTILY